MTVGLCVPNCRWLKWKIKLGWLISEILFNYASGPQVSREREREPIARGFRISRVGISRIGLREAAFQCLSYYLISGGFKKRESEFGRSKLLPPILWSIFRQWVGLWMQVAGECSPLCRSAFHIFARIKYLSLLPVSRWAWFSADHRILEGSWLIAPLSHGFLDSEKIWKWSRTSRLEAQHLRICTRSLAFRSAFHRFFRRFWFANYLKSLDV